MYGYRSKYPNDKRKQHSKKLRNYDKKYRQTKSTFDQLLGYTNQKYNPKTEETRRLKRKETTSHSDPCKRLKLSTDKQLQEIPKLLLDDRVTPSSSKTTSQHVTTVTNSTPQYNFKDLYNFHISNYISFIRNTHHLQNLIYNSRHNEQQSPNRNSNVLMTYSQASSKRINILSFH